MSKLELTKIALMFLSRAVNERENNIKPSDFDFDVWQALHYLQLANLKSNG
jgi:hypothetical protein